MPRPRIGKRITVSLPPDLYEKIQEYMKKEHIIELSDAIRRLLYKAIENEHAKARAELAAAPSTA